MIKGQYDYECDLCGAVFRDSFTVGPSLEKPCPPLNWMVIGERLICDQHDLSKITLAEVLGMRALTPPIGITHEGRIVTVGPSDPLVFPTEG